MHALNTIPVLKVGGAVARLKGKIALVSGGARGQGASHGELFAEEGAKVVLGDVRDELGMRQTAYLTGRGLDVLYTHLDVSSSSDWEGAVALAEQRYGKLNVLVNNAGITSPATLLDEDEETWEQMVAVNQKGVWLGMKHAIPAMLRAGGGSVINISSIWGIAGADGSFAYQATKGAVAQMTKAAAITHSRDNIRVNSICPGLVMTPMAEEEGEESNNAVIAMTPLGRGARPREISYGALFLASDESSYMTGSELAIDGGYLAQ
jgi:NAD(P)-dependent dehydrogenase (short-subunit alcohol dehydrogenase family)